MAAAISREQSLGPKIMRFEQIKDLCCKHEKHSQVHFPLGWTWQERIRAVSRAAVSFPDASGPEYRIEPGKVLFFISEIILFFTS